jgi:hypothetical protein
MSIVQVPPAATAVPEHPSAASWNGALSATVRTVLEAELELRTVAVARSPLSGNVGPFQSRLIAPGLTVGPVSAEEDVSEEAAWSSEEPSSAAAMNVDVTNAHTCRPRITLRP